MPAENKGNGLQIWSASRASFAVTARHKSAGRIVTNRTAGASRAQIARCGTARGKLGASLAWQCPETPPATGEKDVGPRQAVGQQNVSTAENWDNGFRIGRAARASLDVAARRNSAGRIVTIGKTNARHSQRKMSHGAQRNIEHHARGSAPRRRWRPASKTWGHGWRPGSEAFCRQRVTTTVCVLAVRRGHRWTPRRVARVRAA